MRLARWLVGLALVSTCALLAMLCHRGIHMGAWLMDKEDEMDDCQVCSSDDDVQK